MIKMVKAKELRLGDKFCNGGTIYGLEYTDAYDDDNELHRFVTIEELNHGTCHQVTVGADFEFAMYFSDENDGED